MLLEYRLPSSVETLLKPPVVGRQRDGKAGERETRAMQKGHRVHRTRVEFAAKVMTSKGSLTSARQISITARPPVYPFHQPPISLYLSLFLSASPSPRALVSFPYTWLRAAIFDRTRKYYPSSVYRLAQGKSYAHCLSIH